MYSSIKTTYHWHTSHNCDSLTSEDRVQGHGTRGFRINYSRVFEGTEEEASISFTEWPWRIHPRKAWNWWILVKLINGTHIFHRKVSNGKTGLPFQTFHLFRKVSSGTHQKSLLTHLHPNRNFRNLLVNGKRPKLLLTFLEWRAKSIKKRKASRLKEKWAQRIYVFVLHQKWKRTHWQVYSQKLLK